MRVPIDAERLRAFLTALGAQLRRPVTVYLTGGASAVLVGWRESTLDLDLTFVPDSEVFAALPRLKEEHQVNIELASPDHFLPPLPGWQQRSPLIERIGVVECRHYDFYAQALAKIERGFSRDLLDAREMVRRGFVDPRRLLGMAREIEPELVRYPAVDPASFLAAVEAFVQEEIELGS